MTKINFTKDHFAKLQKMATEMLFNNEAVITKLGSPLTIVDLLHLTTIGTLNDIRLSLGKAIDRLENQDEWTSTEDTQEKLAGLKNKKELVNLIIGYKRFLLEQEAVSRKKQELTNKLNNLKESTKTPEDKIKELEEELATLNNETI